MDREKEMKVYVCYLTRYKKDRLVKIISTFELAKKWQHQTSDLIMNKGELLHIAYLKTFHWKRPFTNKDHTIRKNKHAEAWFNYLKENDFDGTETRSSPYFHEWELINQ